MKYVIVRCEDTAPLDGELVPLLEGAKAAHLQQLAQAGAGGVLRPLDSGPGRCRGSLARGRPEQAKRVEGRWHGTIDRTRLHRALLGVAPDDPDGAPARWYAAAAKLQVGSGETCWCAELVTQRDGILLDPTAGNLSSKEAGVLIQALNSQLGSRIRRWEIGHGTHHLLVAADASLGVDRAVMVPPPELVVGKEWRRRLPTGALRKPLLTLIEEASQVLEAHPINRVRIDLGENPANMLWLWGPTYPQPQQTIATRPALTGAVLSNSFAMRGFAHCLGFDWKAGPATFEEGPLRRLAKEAAALLERCELVYIHLQVTDAQPVNRLCIMERLDQILLRSLTDVLPTLGPWRLLVVIDDPVHGVVPFVAIGTGLPQQPIVHLNAEQFTRSPLVFSDGADLFSWFTDDRAS